MFAYCSNNPVNMIDPDGRLAFLAAFVFAVPIISTIAIAVMTYVPIFIQEASLVMATAGNQMTAMADKIVNGTQLDKVNDGSGGRNSSKDPNKNKSNSIMDKVKSKNLPTEGKIKFEPKGNNLEFNKQLKGYVDSHGNVWRKGPYHGDPNLDFQFEWDVVLSKKGVNMWGEYLKPGKNYINVRPDGVISH
jgi:hypothetical protein